MFRYNDPINFNGDYPSRSNVAVALLLPDPNQTITTIKNHIICRGWFRKPRFVTLSLNSRFFDVPFIYFLKERLWEQKEHTSRLLNVVNKNILTGNLAANRSLLSLSTTLAHFIPYSCFVDEVVELSIPDAQIISAAASYGTIPRSSSATVISKH